MRAQSTFICDDAAPSPPHLSKRGRGWWRVVVWSLLDLRIRAFGATLACVFYPTPHSEVGNRPKNFLLGFRASPKFPPLPAWISSDQKFFPAGLGEYLVVVLGEAQNMQFTCERVSGQKLFPPGLGEYLVVVLG